MESYMKEAEKGRFKTIPINNNRQDEITQLKRVFNKMVVRIERLITKVKEEEETIRKNELDLIQAQINPHFLYNTLDAISALALIKENKKTYDMSQSLGKFYRTSLSGGQEMITVHEEIECLRSYLHILDIRYESKYEVQFNIDASIVEYPY